MRVSLMLIILTTAFLTPISSTADTPTTHSRQELVDIGEQCKGKSFEWLFVYTDAFFEVDIGTFDTNSQTWQWKDGGAFAEAWVNDSLAGELRNDVDELVGSITSVYDDDGNDEYLGTDEIEFLTGAGPECLSKVETRIGITPSWSPGEEWENITWGEPDTIEVIEVNGVPAGPDGNYSTVDDPTQLKECDGVNPQTGQKKSDCFEFPADPEVLGEDIYLNLTGDMKWRGLSDTSSFSMLLNGTPNATYILRLPPIPDLQDGEEFRLVSFDVHERNSNFGLPETPVVSMLEDGRYEVVVNMIPGVWELRFGTGRPPTISANIPEPGTIFHAPADSNQQVVASAAEVSTWFDGDLNQLKTECTAPTNWIVTLDGEYGLRASIPNSATKIQEISCEIMSTNDTLTYMLGPVITEVLNGDTLTVQNTEDIKDLEIEYGLSSSQSIPVSWTPINLGTGIQIDTEGKEMGNYRIWLRTTSQSSQTIFPFTLATNQILIIENTAPIVQQITASWENRIVTLQIQVTDNEGDTIKISPYIGNERYSTAQGKGPLQIQADLTDMDLNENVSIRMEICDSQEACIEIIEIIDASHLAALQDSGSASVTSENDKQAGVSEETPSLSLILTVFVLVLSCCIRGNKIN